MTSVAAQPDLLSWPMLREHADAVARAEADLQEARRRFRFAPHGQVRARAEALQAAATRALEAELAYQRVRQEALH
jgi:hypothetical protein